ncbi:MAG: acyltransferase family protein [Paludibacteraceae bacterium]|jgi:surface polysaccharide O-acyltransferase-like enzyme
MASENRIIELDLLRVMAIFLVILQHSWSMLGLDSAADGMQYHFYRFAIIGVPLFVMISGSLLLRKGNASEAFLKKTLCPNCFTIRFLDYDCLCNFLFFR